MRLGFRRTLRLGPLRFNFGRRGFTSYSIKAGAWSWNSRTKAHRVDLLGGFHATSGRRRTDRGRR